MTRTRFNFPAQISIPVRRHEHAPVNYRESRELAIAIPKPAWQAAAAEWLRSLTSRARPT
jgi:hypothetical protein